MVDSCRIAVDSSKYKAICSSIVEEPDVAFFRPLQSRCRCRLLYHCNVFNIAGSALLSAPSSSAFSSSVPVIVIPVIFIPVAVLRSVLSVVVLPVVVFQ